MAKLEKATLWYRILSITALLTICLAGVLIYFGIQLNNELSQLEKQLHDEVYPQLKFVPLQSITQEKAEEVRGAKDAVMEGLFDDIDGDYGSDYDPAEVRDPTVDRELVIEDVAY